MRLPSIHLNGTSAEALERQYENASTALVAAIEALCEASPNGRDYYVQGASATQEAIAEHEARIKSLRAVLKDVDTLGSHVQVIINERGARKF